MPPGRAPQVILTRKMGIIMPFMTPLAGHFAYQPVAVLPAESIEYASLLRFATATAGRLTFAAARRMALPVDGAIKLSLAAGI